MQTVEMYFNTMIEKYTLFKETASLLFLEVPLLTPGDINLRCEELSTMHDDLTADKDHLFALMELVGPGILDTSYIGEFQRALDKSILACDALFTEILSFRQNLVSRLDMKSFSTEIL